MNGSGRYSVRLVYYGRADLLIGDKGTPIFPMARTSNIRIVAFPSASETMDSIGIYELVKEASE